MLTTVTVALTALSVTHPGSGGLVNPCLNMSAPYHTQTWCDPTQGVDTRAADAVSRMTTAEKIANLDTGGAPIPSLGLPKYNWWEEASSGVSNGQPTTKFPYPITTGMSFNKTLWQAVGRAIGHEARALMNAGEAGSTYWAPVVNLAREPRWGRNIEVPGEDPYQSGQYARYFVNGFEEAPEDPFHIQASACCKHYVANSMESTNQPDGESWTRHNFDANISQQDLVDSYMLPFQYCVEQGRVSGLMCSYNAVNGVPSCANKWLLNEVARGEWGFNGYITSDCGAENDVTHSHNFAPPAQAAQDILRAGTDVDCGGFMGGEAQDALNQKTITMDDIDTALTNLFRVRMRLGHFDPPGPLQQFPASDVCSDEHIALAMDGLAQSAALIKNTDNTVPLSKSSSIAVIGPNANLSKSMVSYYGPHTPCGSNYPTLVDAAGKFGSKVTSAPGVPSITSNDTSGIPAAVAMAQAADEVVLAVGTDLSWAHEGHDSDSIVIPDGQMQLINAVAKAAKSPVTVVFFCANPLDLTDLMSNDKIGAIFYVGQPSLTIYGLAEVLFGETSPAGRMQTTVYPAAYADQISIFDFGMRPGPSPFARPDCTNKDPTQCPKGTNPGRTHRFYTGKPVVPYGMGLSYTTFSYNFASAPSTSQVSLDAVRNFLGASTRNGKMFPSLDSLDELAPLVQYEVNVTNTGKMDSDHVVLGMMVPPGAGQNGVPLEQLFGFERVFIKAGETVTVYLYPRLAEFTQPGLDGVRVAHPGEYTFRFGIPETKDLGMGYLEHKITAV